MQGDRSKGECNQDAQDLPTMLETFWGNQLEWIKQRVEGQGSATTAMAKADGAMQLKLARSENPS